MNANQGKILYRCGEISDIPTLLSIHEDAVRNLRNPCSKGYGKFDPLQIQAWIEKENEERMYGRLNPSDNLSKVTYVALLNGEPVGYTHIIKDEIDQLFVSSAGQGQGIGLGLLELAEEFIFSQHSSTIVETVAPSFSFYLKHGYRFDSRSPVIRNMKNGAEIEVRWLRKDRL